MMHTETVKPTFDKTNIIPERYLHLSDGEMIRKIYEKKRQFGDDLLILAHHYQKNEIIPFADYVGDSLQLAKEAALTSQPNTSFSVAFISWLKRLIC